MTYNLAPYRAAEIYCYLAERKTKAAQAAMRGLVKAANARKDRWEPIRPKLRAAALRELERAFVATGQIAEWSDLFSGTLRSLLDGEAVPGTWKLKGKHRGYMLDADGIDLDA